jgi:NAD(P)-dependent dehydrogenase (short-subunit alcohol dehydrogenase family)
MSPDRMPLRFDGRTAVVTGAGGGLGREHAQLLASLGASVLVNDIGCSPEGEGRSDAPAERVAQELRDLGWRAAANSDNGVTRQGAEAMVRAAETAFGPVDVILNSAGIAAELPIGEMTEEMIDSHLNVSVKMPFFLAMAAWNGMVERRYGRILNTTSGAGLYGRAGNSAYAASKMGLVGLSKALALEGARHNIHVNVLSPAAATRNSYYIPSPLREWFEANCPAARVAPMAVWLVHEDCPANGEIIASVAGAGARVFIGETEGVAGPMETIEEVRDRFVDVCDGAVVHVPTSAYDSMRRFGAPAPAPAPS